MKRSILFIQPSMGIGGVEKALLSLVNVLVDKYDVYLMLITPSGEFMKYLPEGVKLIECPFKKEILNIPDKGLASIIRTYIADKRIFSLIRLFFSIALMKFFGCDKMLGKALFNRVDLKFDCICNFPGPNHYTSILAEHICKSEKKFIWIHNEFKSARKSAANFKKRYEKYDKIFAVSESCRDEFVELLPELTEKTEVLYNITDPKLYYKMASDKESFNDGYQGVRILSVGRLSYQKGFDIAAEISNELRNEGYSFRWYIIGRGEEEEHLNSLITKYQLQDCFCLLGAKDNPYPYFRDCDLYVQPSRFEGYGLTVAEAKAFHKPVVCTDFAGAFEQITDGKNGFIVSCEKETIKNAVKKLLDDNEIAKSFSRELKETSVSNIEEVNRFEQFIKE